MTPNYAIKVAQGVASALGINCSNVDNLTWYKGYADGRSAPKGVIAGNWNNDEVWNSTTKSQTVAPGNIMTRLCNILERMGVEIEWFDNVSFCDECCLCVQTEPDSYSWKEPYAAIDGCSLVCENCIKADPTDYLEGLEDNADACMTLDLDLTEYGYVKMNAAPFQSGWHPGQTDSPKRTLDSMHEQGMSRIIFAIDTVGQFDTHWDVYVHEEGMPEEGEDE